jgi:hypothetical protein
MDYSYLNQAGFDPAMSAAVAAADNSFYGDLVTTRFTTQPYMLLLLSKEPGKTNSRGRLGTVGLLI